MCSKPAVWPVPQPAVKRQRSRLYQSPNAPSDPLSSPAPAVCFPCPPQSAAGCFKHVQSSSNADWQMRLAGCECTQQGFPQHSQGLIKRPQCPQSNSRCGHYYTLILVLLSFPVCVSIFLCDKMRMSGWCLQTQQQDLVYRQLRRRGVGRMGRTSTMTRWCRALWMALTRCALGVTPSPASLRHMLSHAAIKCGILAVE